MDTNQILFASTAILLLRFSASLETEINGCKEPISGQSCRLTCVTEDSPRVTRFRKSSLTKMQGECSSSGVCESDRSGYKVSQSRSETFKTYLDISNLVYRRDNDIWTCEYGISTSRNNFNLVVHTIPTNISIPVNVSKSNLPTISGQASCVYPDNVKMELVYQDSDQDNVLGEFTTAYSVQGVTGCEEHEYQVTGLYNMTQSNVETLTGKSVRFKIRVTVNGLSAYQESDLTTIIEFTDNPSRASAYTIAWYLIPAILLIFGPSATLIETLVNILVSEKYAK